MADNFNRSAMDRTLARMVDQRKADNKGKGESRTELQHMKDTMTQIAKDTTKKIDEAARKREGGGQSFYMGGESAFH